MSSKTVGARTSVAPRDYRLVRLFVIRGLGLTLFLAFGSLWLQIDGLMGSGGILPAADFMTHARSVLGGFDLGRLPTLCWVSCSDAMLNGLCGAGVGLSLLVLFGIAPPLSLFGAWAVYLSLCSVGGPFLSYQWDALLLEACFVGIFLAPRQKLPGDAMRFPVPTASIFMMRWLVFRLFFMSGAVKWLSEDPVWRDFTALNYHYFTQPLPGWTSYFAHHAPDLVHRIGVAATFGIELIAPFCIFGPRRVRIGAFLAFTSLQLTIAVTGNYGFFNLLTFVLCLTLLDDETLRRALPTRCLPALPPAEAERQVQNRPRAFATTGIAIVVIGLTGLTTLTRLGLFAPSNQVLSSLRSLAPFRTLNQYGLFAVMTTRRGEIEMEGSLDGKEWRTYRFRHKPGDPFEAPGFSQPHMPRLDWQMWFAALGTCSTAPWLRPFAERLLEASPAVLGLLAHDPFDGQKPLYLRSVLYDYEFEALDEFRQTGQWWTRRRLGNFCPVWIQE